MSEKNRVKDYFQSMNRAETLDVPSKMAIWEFCIDDNISNKGDVYANKIQDKVRTRSEVLEERSWAVCSEAKQKICNGIGQTLLPGGVSKVIWKGGCVMAWLKVYEWEHDTWPEFRKVKIDRRQQHGYIKKLARHFKIVEPTLRWSYKRGVASGEGGGSYHYRTLGSFIRIGKVTTLGTLCHEFAHHLAAMRWGSWQGHNKKFKRELKRTYTWAKRWLEANEVREGK